MFAVLTVLLPFAGLLLVEGGLRLAGYGQSYPLFIPAADGGDYRMASSKAIRRFVPNPADVPRLMIRPVTFRAEKRPKTFRVVVQGGSTAAGYPYGYGASPAGMLQQRLQRTFPDRRVEVITTATSAVNSYTLLDFSREIVEQEPDAVVVYAGHNEYLGILGVGSSVSAGRRRPLVLSFLALKDVRLLQLGRRALAGAAGLFRDEGDGSRRTLMERVVAEDRIPYGSSLYHRGLTQYRANLRALLRRYREAGVPVFIGTVVANERDQPPFISGHSRGVDLEAWQGHFDAGLNALRSGDPEAALASFEAAIALDDLHADVHFGRGRALEALGRYPEARRAYLTAKDRDELRFRAPQAINDAVREVAAEQGAHVVEVERAFAEASENGVVGRELILEHLHPNLDGYFLMADAFYDAMEGHEALGLGSWEHSVPDAQARREMPVTEVDRLYGEYRILRLTAGWPFSDGDGDFALPPAESRVERIAQGFFRGSYPWPGAMRRLLDHYRTDGKIGEAAKVAVLLAEAFPERRADQVAAARLLREAGRTDYRTYRRRANEQRATVVAGQ
ncbi:MAG: tetratricopeptide repeat protein [Thermoanaerobaculia bacterium]